MKLKVAIQFLTLFPILLCFQNCSPEHLSGKDSNDSSSTEFFNYPYQTKPNFYASINLYRIDSNIAGVNQFQVLNSASLIKNPDAPIQYQVKVRDRSGNILCPLRSGINAPGISTISFDCATPNAVTTISIEMTLKAGTDVYTMEKIFE